MFYAIQRDKYIIIYYGVGIVIHNGRRDTVVIIRGGGDNNVAHN